MIKINKKILILTCIIITILAAGLVSATAVNKTATTNPHKYIKLSTGQFIQPTTT